MVVYVVWLFFSTYHLSWSLEECADFCECRREIRHWEQAAQGERRCREESCLVNFALNIISGTKVISFCVPTIYWDSTRIFNFPFPDPDGLTHVIIWVLPYVHSMYRIYVCCTIAFRSILFTYAVFYSFWFYKFSLMCSTSLIPSKNDPYCNSTNRIVCEIFL